MNLSKEIEGIFEKLSEIEVIRLLTWFEQSTLLREYERRANMKFASSLYRQRYSTNEVVARLQARGVSRSSAYRLAAEVLSQNGGNSGTDGL